MRVQITCHDCHYIVAASTAVARLSPPIHRLFCWERMHMTLDPSETGDAPHDTNAAAATTCSRPPSTTATLDGQAQLPQRSDVASRLYPLTYAN